MRGVIDEDEDGARNRVAFESLPYDGGECVDPLPKSKSSTATRMRIFGKFSENETVTRNLCKGSANSMRRPPLSGN